MCRCVTAIKWTLILGSVAGILAISDGGFFSWCCKDAAAAGSWFQGLATLFAVAFALYIPHRQHRADILLKMQNELEKNADAYEAMTPIASEIICCIREAYEASSEYEAFLNYVRNRYASSQWKSTKTMLESIPAYGVASGGVVAGLIALNKSVTSSLDLLDQARDFNAPFDRMLTVYRDNLRIWLEQAEAALKRIEEAQQAAENGAKFAARHGVRLF